MREKNQAATSDQRLFNLEHQVDVNKQKKEFYEKSLQEIMLFKRRTDVALMEIEERARQEQQAADEAEQKYEQVKNRNLISLKFNLIIFKFNLMKGEIGC